MSALPPSLLSCQTGKTQWREAETETRTTGGAPWLVCGLNSAVAGTCLSFFQWGMHQIWWVWCCFQLRMMLPIDDMFQAWNCRNQPENETWQEATNQIHRRCVGMYVSINQFRYLPTKALKIWCFQHKLRPASYACWFIAPWTIVVFLWTQLIVKQVRSQLGYHKSAHASYKNAIDI